MYMMDKSLMEKKRLMATMYLKNGCAIRGKDDDTVLGPANELARLYNDSGIDKIMLWDLSETKEEHNNTLKVIREIESLVHVNKYKIEESGNLVHDIILIRVGDGSVFLCGIGEAVSCGFQDDALSTVVDVAIGHQAALARGFFWRGSV